MIKVLRETWALKETQNSKNKEKAIKLYLYKRNVGHNKIIIDSVFSFRVVTKITNDFESQTVDECRQIHDGLNEKSNTSIIDFST